MNELSFQKEYKLSQLITDIALRGYTSDNFCLYTKEYTSSASKELVVYLERFPTINDRDEEEYPYFVVKNKLELFFYGEQFEDVLTSALNQNKNASIDDFIAALNFYLNNDAFITFGP
ncbi:TPA: hypothetical protein RZA60_003266 [Vibrio vulnificus]|nr:hypothetical protein [Vibrio vulnificus]HAS6385870.1 hypothetical protein [Vibrio vulnificus]HDY7624910.1 hypothetical protein [Vibrio vulnificus]HEB2782904.1 hypothetical protein [Vibrio vulnificus]